MNNLFTELFDIERVKEEIEQTQNLANFEQRENCVILCSNYSINISMEYNKTDDPEQIDWDWQDFEELIGYNMSVNQYDDLVIEITPE